MKKLTITAILTCIAFPQGVALAQDNVIRLNLDATDVTRRLLHVRMTFPAKPGPMTLLYPKWIPGEHGPTGPITDLAGLKIMAGAQTIPWNRDPVNMYAFHLTVPPNTNSIDVTFDFISPPDSPGFSSGSSVTTELAVLSWNQVLLYPEGVPSDQLRIQASLKLPSSWRFGTALPIARESGQQVEFQPSSLTTLVDSPISAGTHYRTVDLGTDQGIRHYLHIAGDSDAAVDIPASLVTQYQNLVKEASALYGSHHYRDYHFLLTLSDHVAHFGLEHHESSDDRLPERSIVDEGPRKVSADLLSHEFTHSWNGKFRRPAGLITADYSQPMKGDLLWVYEGLTEYLGEILSPRSGLETPDDFRERLALEAARLDKQSGRTWRPLEDTAVAAQLLYEARDDYAEFRRGVDYYDEGTLIWLEADTLIRQLSKGAKSLDDFCKLFHGGTSGTPEVKPYTFEDVVAGLNAVQAYDWASFLRTRLDSTVAHAPLGGIENSGWKLTYGSTRSEMQKATEEYRKSINLAYSIGMVVGEEGVIQDVSVGGAAQKAGVAPSGKIIAVNRRQFTAAILRDAVERTSPTTEPLELLVKDGEYYSTFKVDYHGGGRYPRLERDASKPDLLSQIITPRVKR